MHGRQVRIDRAPVAGGRKRVRIGRHPAVTRGRHPPRRHAREAALDLELLFAFTAGVLTILAPCTLPVIPVVLGGAAGPGDRRLLGIFGGFAATFVATTVVIASLLAALGLTTDILRTMAAILIGIVGATLALPVLGRMLDSRLAGVQAAGLGAGTARVTGDGFWRGTVVGSALGLIWAPCAGPLMAAVIATAIVHGPTIDGLLIALAYAVGVTVPLTLIAVFSRRALRRVGPRAADRLRRVFGVAMMVVSVGVLTGLDVPVQSGLTASVASLTAAVSDRTSPTPVVELPALDDLGAAPELVGITAWINSDPTTIAALRGKVVLVHFWTFACVNCRHVQPYVKAWYDDYRDDGFVVLGVHTPELSFERDIGNVRQAVAEADVRFPVAFDPAFATWQAYHNGAWPAFYFIDKRGHIRYRYGGEGRYDQAEAVIRALLAEPG